MGLFLADLDDFVCVMNAIKPQISRDFPADSFPESVRLFAQAGGLLDLEEMPHAKEVLLRVKEAGHVVKYLSNRSDVWYPAHMGHVHSMMYLTERKFPNDGVIIAADGKTKYRELAWLKPDVYGDNRLEHVKEAVDAGIEAVFWLDLENGPAGRDNNHFRVPDWYSIEQGLEDIGFIPKLTRKE